MYKPMIFLFFSLLLLSCKNEKKGSDYISFSGIYPHLARYNNEGECGTGAIVPWAGKLWIVTYGPHLPFGSSDKLYEIDDNLNQVVFAGSIGGTPANRMIHNESNQLFIGPYAIDGEGKIRVIPYELMPGRLTGNARHLTDPAGKIYCATMEEGFYEIDVKTLIPGVLYEDANLKQPKGDDIAVNQRGSLLPGAHGKGVYSGQGVLVYSNNGEASEEALVRPDIESGSLCEWNGKDWKLIRRNQFVEVTGPGGIYGNKNPETDPIWVTGWDHKSVIVGVRDNSKWFFYRLPKASHSYDGAHGWNTEWPRIRDIGTPENPDYLMTMHGMFWRFPSTFTSENSKGIRPRSAYLKVIGDFTLWNGRLVFGCDDSAQREFLNKRKAKGNIEGPGQSNSNTWFTSSELPDSLGPNTAEGAVWLNENVKSGIPSEPFLFAGWPKRCAWIKNEGKNKTGFRLETDIEGNGNWTEHNTYFIEAGKTMFIDFTTEVQGEWIRVVTDSDTKATVHFSYSDEDNRSINSDKMFSGLAPAYETAITGGMLYGLGNNRRALGMLALSYNGQVATEKGYYELDSLMHLVRKEDPETEQFIRERFAIPQNVVTIDESSVLIIDDRNRRWRLPLGDSEFASLTGSGYLRICREVATERDLFNCMGTFYELPAENADGFAKIRPISSHNFRINDYASYRGMLIMTGINPEMSENNSHLIISDDKKAAVWAGVIDDLWKLGKTSGHGGPWKDSDVKAGEPSDPYLIGFYDKKNLKLSHNQSKSVSFTIEVDPTGNGPWMIYNKINVDPGKTFEYDFPENFSSRWIRFSTDNNCKATAWLLYK
ncbi:MAG TPA: hypothetical protein VMV47_11805 [Bacteroidales bacterium]|nr:hypothetical protein [Bacteroidales bacterium]